MAVNPIRQHTLLRLKIQFEEFWQPRCFGLYSRIVSNVFLLVIFFSIMLTFQRHVNCSTLSVVCCIVAELQQLAA